MRKFVYDIGSWFDEEKAYSPKEGSLGIAFCAEINPRHTRKTRYILRWNLTIRLVKFFYIEFKVLETKL